MAVAAAAPVRFPATVAAAPTTATARLAATTAAARESATALRTRRSESSTRRLRTIHLRRRLRRRLDTLANDGRADADRLLLLLLLRRVLPHVFTRRALIHAGYFHAGSFAAYFRAARFAEYFRAGRSRGYPAEPAPPERYCVRRRSHWVCSAWACSAGRLQTSASHPGCLNCWPACCCSPLRWTRVHCEGCRRTGCR